MLCFFRPHFKADPPDSLDIVLSVSFPEFPAEVADVHFQGIVRAVRSVLADAVQQQGFGDDLGGILKEEL